MGSSTTPEQKVAILAKNFILLEREQSKNVTASKQNEKHLELVQREKENLQKDYNKGVLMRFGWMDVGRSFLFYFN